jgi:hypothetical protein
MSSLRSVRGVVLAALGVLLLEIGPGASPGVAGETGELWESTVEMTMSGNQAFALPAQTSRSCRPRGNAWSEPPAPEKSDCQMSDVARSGNTMTWSMRCTEPPVTGNGKITFEGADRYSGEIAATMPQGSMTMKLSGKRVGDCDYGAEQARVEALERQGADYQAAASEAMAKTCAEGARTGYAMMFVGPTAACTQPQHKQAFCAGLATPTGYAGAAGGAVMGVDLAKAAEFCGTEPQALRSEACRAALEGGALQFVVDQCPERTAEICPKALAAKEIVLLVEHCPAESQKLAQEQCAGRQYTSQMAEEYRAFCSEYARAAMQETPPQAEPAAEGKKSVKKKILGALGR